MKKPRKGRRRPTTPAVRSAASTRAEPRAADPRCLLDLAADLRAELTDIDRRLRKLEGLAKSV